MPVITKAMIFLEGIAMTGDPGFDQFKSAYPYSNLDHFMPVNVDYYDIKLNLYTNVTLKIGKNYGYFTTSYVPYRETLGVVYFVPSYQ